MQPGDVVDVAFSPQINEFRGERTVQMNVLDIRPHCDAACLPDAAGYAGLRRGNVSRENAHKLLPDRATFGVIWRYLAASDGTIREEPMCLCRKIVRWSGKELSLGKLLTCLDIFTDVGLLETQRRHKNILIRLTPGDQKADLNDSNTMQILLRAKES